MYAMAFDLIVAEAEKHHPKSVTQAYAEIGAVLGEHGFRRVQGSLYVTEMKTWRTYFLLCKRYATERGSRNLCEIFGHSVSSSGRILPL
jgi:virulence-associated protein VapD